MSQLVSGSRAPIMMDVVAMAMGLVLPLLMLSIYLIRVKRLANLHKKIQTSLGLVLLVAVALFEIDVRWHGWQDGARVSPYFTTYVWPVLIVHLFFAVSTAILWVFLLGSAWRSPPKLGFTTQRNLRHKLWGRIAISFMVGTALTGWSFYWLAFIATA